MRICLTVVNTPETEHYVDRWAASYEAIMDWVKVNYPDWSSLVITVVS